MSQKESGQWDALRFGKTLAYFGIIPFIGSISWLQELFTGRSEKKQQNQGGDNKMGVVLVAGATGGVGKRVVRRLLAKGYRVRAIARDPDRAKALLGDKVEIVFGDITIPETLTAEVMRDVRAIVSGIGVRVQPVEGDTPERDKYNQGIKFYQPEIVGDTPENVEYRGIKNLVQAAAANLNRDGEKLVFDFTKPSADLKETWGALDDVVMGGVSESSIRFANDTAVFFGNVSTANSGGFASVRTRNFNPGINLSGYEGIELRVRGDGKRYKFFIRSNSAWDGIGYAYSFDTVYNIWTTVRIPFKDLIPVFRAKTVKDAAPIDASQIYSFQLMLSKFEYDGQLNPKFQPGLFQLEVESIKAYGGKTLPKFVMVSSAGVTRPGRPGINLEEEPPAVRLNDQLGGILTWKLRGEEVLRQSRIPYTIIRPCALTEEAGGKALMFDQGDNIKGKVSREDVAELCVYSLEQPKACNVTFEVKEAENGEVAKNWERLFSSLKSDELAVK
ncbi:CIA30 family protein [Microseira sp. BLCC-F43]|jgi:uncharacterized protein YbjT (DUF2867 family)|uniref:CIA30 family protein n=1 Tax=Microseira sp. BLCC-F43 TaxID=3153602 RepID=UPI0035BB9329